MKTTQFVVMCFSILVVLTSSALYLYGARITAKLKPFVRWLNPATRTGLVLLAVSAVFWVANMISIDAGKGLNSMCTVLGCMLAGAGIALTIVGGRVER